MRINLAGLLLLIVAGGGVAMWATRGDEDPALPLVAHEPTDPVSAAGAPVPVAPLVESEEWWEGDAESISAAPEQASPPDRPALPEFLQSPGNSYWNQGADGFAAAAQEAKDEGRPMIVYFYTDWCGYCRELESELMASVEVGSLLRYFAKARVNPEHGPMEQAIAKSYGVRGFPTVFVHRADRPDQVQKIGRGAGSGPERRLKTPQEYARTLLAATGVRAPS